MAEQDLRAVAFPKLNEAQLASLGGCSLTVLKRYRDGEKLFEVGDRDFKFFVIKSGHIEIRDESGDTPKTVVVLGPGEFTGEVTQLTGTPSLVGGAARGDCEVYELSHDALRQLINHHPEVGDLILQAFIARRQILHESENFTGLRVIGSRYSQDTFRIRDFLAKNRMPFKWLDLETDPQVNQLLKQFGVTEADTPVVALGHKLLLRNPSNRRVGGNARAAPALERDRVRFGRGRRRSRGTRGGGLRRFGGPPHGGAGANGTRRSGRPQHAHRELPRLSDRHHRRRVGGARRLSRPTSSARALP